MVYSVWRPELGLYDYYEDGRREVGPPVPSHIPVGSSGIVPEAAAYPLPADARRTGRGAEARGMVARLGGVDGGSNWTVPLGLVLIGYGLYRFTRP